MLNIFKKTILVLFVFISSIATAQKLTVYDQLVAVNNEWKNQPDVDPVLKNKPAIPLNERELVRMHLVETEKLLRARDHLQLTATQKKNRESNLNTLHRYWQNAVFPLNNLYQDRQPIFIDQFNTYCAVGYLIKESGAGNVAKEIQQKQNYSYLADIDHPKLMEWVNNSGLDFGELELIQPGYGGEWPTTITEMHYNNTGTDVNEYIELHQSNGGLIGMQPLQRIEFFDQSAVLYKTLFPADMQIFLAPTPYYYYQFPSNENFADNGIIIIFSNNPVGIDTIATFLYDAAGVTMKDYYNVGQPFTRSFNVKEDETTPIGNALTFCGTYPASWSLNVNPATLFSLDPCTLGNAPISLSDFNYSIIDKGVELKWQTVSETNNKYFDIERSADGINYTAIGRMAGAINSTNVKNYSFTDNKPGYINHYRLKQVDLDGKFSYSKILFVKRPESGALILKGNIVQDNLNIQVNSEQINAGKIIIYDFSGRQVQKLPANNGSQTINVSNLDCGKYIIRLYTTDGKVYSQQFVKG